MLFEIRGRFIWTKTQFAKRLRFLLTCVFLFYESWSLWAAKCHKCFVVGIRTCRSGYSRCQNNRCVETTRLCDDINDCGDGSDEANCSCVASTHFQCAAGPCILGKFRCDGDPDCPDASDEMGCRKFEYSLIPIN